MEESPQQIIRNMRSIGIDLQKWVDKKLLKFSARRPNLYGLETHLAAMHRDVSDFDPAAVVIDPMSALMSAGLAGDVHSMILRLVDFLKTRGITALFTNLGIGSAETATTQMQISSLMDTWLLLYNRESNGEHNRQLYVLKSRGMAHSNQMREFILSSDGIKLREALHRSGRRPDRIGPSRTGGQGPGRAHSIRQQEIERRSREWNASDARSPRRLPTYRRNSPARRNCSAQQDVARRSTCRRPGCHGKEPPDRAMPASSAAKPADEAEEVIGQ